MACGKIGVVVVLMLGVVLYNFPLIRDKDEERKESSPLQILQIIKWLISKLNLHELDQRLTLFLIFAAVCLLYFFAILIRTLFWWCAFLAFVGFLGYCVFEYRFA